MVTGREDDNDSDYDLPDPMETPEGDEEADLAEGFQITDGEEEESDIEDLA